MNRGTWGILLALLLAATTWYFLRPVATPPPAPAAGPPAAVLSKLARGVNLSNWLQHGPTPENEADRYVPDAADWALIRALGFLHARILIDPDAFIGSRGLPRPEAFAELRSAIDAAQRADLLVVVALQLPPEHKLPLTGNEADRYALGGTWRALASALRGFPPDRLVLEPLNENQADEALASRTLQSFLVGEVRSLLPQHTLVASGHRYAGIPELEALAPLADRNIVYTFHFYEPHNFTHQGAAWGPPEWKLLRGWPYPSSPERVAPLLEKARPELRDALRWHGDERWSREKIGALLERAAQWGQRHRVPVWCSEFGVLRPRAVAADRRAWLRDMREELEARKLPWTHWDYAGDFGVVTGERGARKLDKGAIAALGLATDVTYTPVKPPPEGAAPLPAKAAPAPAKPAPAKSAPAKTPPPAVAPAAPADSNPQPRPRRTDRPSK